MESLESHNLDDLIANLSEVYKLPEEEVLNIIKQAVKEEWQKSYGEGYNLLVDYNKKIQLSLVFDIVAEVQDEKTEIVGEKIGEKFIDPLELNFSRAAMHNILHNIEKEIKYQVRQREYEYYIDQVGQLFLCVVRRQKGTSTYVEVGGMYDGVIPHNYSVTREKFQKGDKIYCRLAEVNFSMFDSQLLFDRKSPEFVKAILKKFIPEVETGDIQVMDIARDAGSLCKIVVAGSEMVNVIGACMGAGGKRRIAIMEELRQEKVNFLEWADDFEQRVQNFIGNKIKVYQIMYTDEKNIQVVIDDEDYSRVIGRGGQNIFLISRLLNKNIKLMKYSEYKEIQKEKSHEELQEVEKFGIGQFQAIELLDKYGSWHNIIQGADIEDDLRDKIIEFYESKLELERQRFVDMGGDEDFFMFNPDISPNIYFYLLSSGIGSMKKLREYSGNAEKLFNDTELDIDICVLLLQSM